MENINENTNNEVIETTAEVVEETTTPIEIAAGESIKLHRHLKVKVEHNECEFVHCPSNMTAEDMQQWVEQAEKSVLAGLRSFLDVKEDDTESVVELKMTYEKCSKEEMEKLKTETDDVEEGKNTEAEDTEEV